MGTYEELKAAIQQVIRTNGNNEITGALLQNALLSIVNVVGANATFAGIATPNTNPGTADQNVFYLATEAGTYVNFGGIEINMGEAVILSNQTGNWVKTTSGFATQQQLTKLNQSVNLFPFDSNQTTDIFVSDGRVGRFEGWAKVVFPFTKGKIWGNIDGFNQSGVEIPNVVYLDSNMQFLGCIPAIHSKHDVDSDLYEIPAGTAFVCLQGNTKFETSKKYINISTYFEEIPNYLSYLSESIEDTKDINEKKTEVINLYPFYAGQFLTTDIFVSNGNTNRYIYWAKSIPMPIRRTDRIIGKLFGYNSGGIEIPSIVFLDDNKNFVGAIPAVHNEHLVDTDTPSQAIPEKASFYVIQGNTSEVDIYKNAKPYVYAGKALIKVIEDFEKINGRTTWKTPNLYPFYGGQNVTTDIYKSDGSIGNYSSWAKSDLLPISNKSRLYGKLFGFIGGGIEIPSIVFFDSDKNFIGSIPAQNSEHFVDTNTQSQSIPENTAYFVIQGNTAEMYADVENYLYAEMYFEDAFRYKTVEGLTEPRIPYNLLMPKVVYNVGNDISREIYGFPRNYSVVLYLDNMLPIGLTQEPNVRFEDGSILKSIPCYEPPMKQIQGIGGGWERPLMNNAENKTEIEVLININNESYKQNYIVKNRSVLNSSTANKKANILIIGDSVTFGQNAYFEGNPNKANYTLLLKELFDKDGLQNGGGFDFDTIGTIAYTRNFEYNGNTYMIKAYNEGYAGTTMQNTGLYKNPKFLDDAGNFSFQNWLNKYRTKDINGNQLYFNAQKSIVGTGGDYGYYENGERSNYKIGTEVTDVTIYNVYEPTHVFLFHGSNAQIYKSEYDDFILRVRETFPNAIIGLGVPHVAGTYYPKEFPNYTNCERWNPMLNFGYDQKHYITAQSLDNISSDNTYEQNNVYVIPTYFVNPAAKAIPAMAVSEPMADFVDSGKIYEPKGQAPDVHVGGVAHASYAYQLYAWIKWTL